jgi:hypothetical protein
MNVQPGLLRGKATVQGRGVRMFLRYLVLTLLYQAPASKCGDAVFSNDGQRVYAISSADNKQVLREINLTEQTSRTISLSQKPPQQPLLGITRSEGDKLFCVTEKTSGL